MQGRKFVVIGLYKRHEIFPDHISPFTAFKRGLKIKVNHALLRDLILNVVVYKLRVILRTYSCKRLVLRLRNSELYESVLYILRNVLPAAGHFGLRAHIGRYVFYMKPCYVRSPFRLAQPVICVK